MINLVTMSMTVWESGFYGCQTLCLPGIL